MYSLFAIAISGAEPALLWPEGCERAAAATDELGTPDPEYYSTLSYLLILFVLSYVCILFIIVYYRTLYKCMYCCYLE